MVTKQFAARVLYFAHKPTLSSHPDRTRMYYTLPREHYWPHMASVEVATVRKCASRAATRGILFKNRKDLKLFHAAGPLEFIAMDRLAPLSRTAHGNLHVVVNTG